MEKIIKRVFDVSKEKGVDLMVAKAMVFEEMRNAGTLNNEEFNAAEDFIKEYAEPLCKVYHETGLVGFDRKAFLEEVEENA